VKPNALALKFPGADGVKLGFTTFLNGYGRILTFRCAWYVNISLLNAVQPNLRDYRTEVVFWSHQYFRV